MSHFVITIRKKPDAFCNKLFITFCNKIVEIKKISAVLPELKLQNLKYMLFYKMSVSEWCSMVYLLYILIILVLLLRISYFSFFLQEKSNQNETFFVTKKKYHGQIKLATNLQTYYNGSLI